MAMFVFCYWGKN